MDLRAFVGNLRYGMFWGSLIKYVLERCGFKKIGIEKNFANARGAEIVEYIYELK